MGLIKNDFWDQIEAQKIRNDVNLTPEEKDELLLELLAEAIRDEVRTVRMPS